MALLETAGLAKRFGSKRVFQEVNLKFEAGEIVAVLGVNGAGKTTLLGCLSGILGWSAGEVRLAGRRLDRKDLEQRKQYALMPDRGLWFPWTDPIRNAASFSQLWRGADAGPPLDLEEWLDRLGLMEVAFDPIDGMSRGQAYKSSLLGLHAADPELWLLDEPFAAGMDARGMEAFRAMARAASGRGRCVVYTTQFPELAARFADRVVVIGRGRVVLNDTTVGLEAAEVERRLSRALELEGAGA
ncbi:ABC transporter ATP-binding protein [Luteolibacter sp. LG18]|uniref:ABC transporter ATP-binding protein n=1 Tax=Luteolibacter sp. LG18 TaxID=2819286 RepID=UPI002B2CDF1B|nr:ABC transporter ATP-binding protein [Luteolibacter sp. LG18]